MRKTTITCDQCGKDISDNIGLLILQTVINKQPMDLVYRPPIPDMYFCSTHCLAEYAKASDKSESNE